MKIALIGIIIACTLAGCGQRVITEQWPNGQLKRHGMQHGITPIGEWVYGNASGQILARGSFDALGRQHGLWTWYHPEGSIQRSGAYRAGLREGRWILVHANGVIAEAGHFLRDRHDGVWTWFDSSGATKASGAYANGVRDGRWQTWDAAGAVLSDGFYANGLRVGAWRNGSVSENLPTAQALAATRSAVRDPAPWRLPEGQPLSSPAVVPGIWTSADEAKAPRILATFAGGATAARLAAQPALTEYEIAPAAVAQRQEQRLLGKPLAVTRLLRNDGSVLDLDDLRQSPSGSRSVVVVVMRGFSGQVCIYCAAQTATLADALPRFAARQAEVVVVYPGAVETLPAFVQAVQSLRADPPPFAIAMDVNMALVKALDLEGELAKPTALVIAPDGTVRFAYVGQDLADRPSIDDLLNALPEPGK